MGTYRSGRAAISVALPLLVCLLSFEFGARDAFAATVAYRLAETWRLAAESSVVVGREIDLVWHPDGELLLLDGQLQCVHVFDPAGRWLRALGDEGEGPGRFRAASSLFCDEDGAVVVVQSAPLRLVRFDLAGKVLEMPRFDDGVTGLRTISRMRAHADLRVYEEMATQFSTEGIRLVSRLVRARSDGSARTILVEHEQALDLRAKVLREDAIAPFLGTWCTTESGAVVHLTDFSAYAARIVDLAGRPLQLLTREDVTPAKRDAAELERVRSAHEDRRAGSGPASRRFEPSAASPTLVAAHARANGEIWLQRHRYGASTDAADAVLVLDRFDVQGQFLGQVTVRGPRWVRDARVILDGDRVVAISDGETEGGEIPRFAVFRLETDS